jgi:hypothetical protein
VGLGVELRALFFLGKHSTICAKLPSLFAQIIFDEESHFVPRLAWTIIFLFVFPSVAGGVRHASLCPVVVEMRSQDHFCPNWS